MGAGWKKKKKPHRLGETSRGGGGIGGPVSVRVSSTICGFEYTPAAFS